MKNLRLLLLLVPCALLFGQNSNLFDKAPPEIDEALRARVKAFYSAYVTGKYRDAIQVVEDDSLDEFLAADKDRYLSFDIANIVYSDDFTKAKVTAACMVELKVHGRIYPSKYPQVSSWKYVNGQWWWYHVPLTERTTPFGISKITPEGLEGVHPNVPAIPADPLAAAQAILSKVSIDKAEVELKSYEKSHAEVHVKNDMPGNLTVAVDRLPIAGSGFKIDHSDIPPGGIATITFEYDPKSPDIVCGACTAKAVLPITTASVRISQTGQIFPVRITFALDPEQQKALDKLMPKSDK
jgi:hypothetical protein